MQRFHSIVDLPAGADLGDLVTPAGHGKRKVTLPVPDDVPYGVGYQMVEKLALQMRDAVEKAMVLGTGMYELKATATEITARAVEEAAMWKPPVPQTLYGHDISTVDGFNAFVNMHGERYGFRVSFHEDGRYWVIEGDALGGFELRGVRLNDRRMEWRVIKPPREWRPIPPAPPEPPPKKDGMSPEEIEKFLLQRLNHGGQK